MVRTVGWTVLAAAVLSGCFGPFRLTSTVYAFNEGISDHVAVRELVFVGFLVVPVYPLAAVIDGTVLNTIEFATGENPVDGRARTRDGRRVAVSTGPDGSVDVAIDGERMRRILRRGRSLELVEDGRVLARVDVEEDGGLRVEAGGRVRRVDPGEVAALDALDGAELAAAVAEAWAR